VGDDGMITEGAGSAFFAIFGKTVQTAPLTSKILPSITRKFVIKAAREAGLDVAEQSFTPAQAAKADELFIAVTTKDIVPVVKFDEMVIGDGRPGTRTKMLMERFQSFVA